MRNLKLIGALCGGVTDQHIEQVIKLWCGVLTHAKELFEGPIVEAADGDEDERLGYPAITI